MVNGLIMEKMIPTEIKTENTWYANIWIAGDYRSALQYCREYCFINPLCVTVTPTSFVYKGGLEDGVCVRMINYPRFPKSVESLKQLANNLAEFLRIKLCQESFSIEMPDVTHWVSYRTEPHK